MHERKKELSKRKKNESGQTLLSYEEGFSWCEKCYYVSDIEPESELNQRCKLKGCQRPSCAGSFQWKNYQGTPCTDEDFVCEGYKTVKFCVSYMSGTGCKDGNKCLNSHRYKSDEALPENKERCYVCGLQGKKTGKDRRPSHQSFHSEAPGGGDDIRALRDRAGGWIVKEYPLRPGRIRPETPVLKDFDRSRSKSPDRRGPKERKSLTR